MKYLDKDGLKKVFSIVDNKIDNTAKDYITKDTNQIIDGEKTFNKPINVSGHSLDDRYLTVNSGTLIFHTPDKIINDAAMGLSFKKDNDIIGRIGVYYNGIQDKLINYYFGDYEDPITKIDNDGKITAKSFIAKGGTSSQFLKANGSVDSTEYLPKSGNSTLSGQLTLQEGNEPLSIYRNLNGDLVPHINFHNIVNGVKTYQGEFGMKNTYPMYWDKSESGATWRKVWCEGNDGSGSGLDADLLDGLHSTQFMKNSSTLYSNDLNDITETGRYRIVTGAANAPLGVNVHGSILLHLQFDSNSARQLFYNYHPNATIHTRTKYNAVWNGWKEIAFTDSNVASADKLTTKQLTNEDLNNIKSIPFVSYYAAGNNTCKNIPSAISNAVGFRLWVSGENTNYCTQLLTTSSGNIYKRVCNGASIGWSEWKKMISEDDIRPLIDRIQALEEKLNL